MTLTNPLKRDGITLDLAHQHDGHNNGTNPCRIRLFRKSSRKTLLSVEIAMVWGVEKGGRVDLDQRRCKSTTDSSFKTQS